MEYGDEKREKLDRLERKLYSRNAPDIIDKGRSDLSVEKKEEFNNTEDSEIKENWQDQKAGSFDELTSKISNMAQKKHNFVNKIFMASVLFFVLAAGVAAFVFFGGMNSVSSKNVDIKVVGPLQVGGGQEVSLDINIVNNNNVDLDSASLFIEYATGTRSSVDLSKELSQERFDLGVIKKGESYSKNIKLVFFGEKGSSKQIKISLEYRVANSSALFYKEKVHELSISSAPIIVTATYPKEVNSNQEISLDVEVASNSKDQVGDLLVSLEYPFGFVFKDSTPKASFGNNVWKFSQLNSGEKKNIVVRGSVIGQDNEEKVFKINTGTASVDDERIIAVPFSQLMESVLVKKSFIGLDVFIEGKEGDYAAKGDGQVATEFVVINNLPSRLFDVSAEATLTGGAFSPAGVFAGNTGFFQSFNNTILWDKRSVSEFADMSPGSEKSLSFRLVPLLYADIAKGVKPEIQMTIKIKGERVSESGSTETVSVTEVRKIVLTTNINFSSKITRSVGSIENSGPIPPKADVPTTYTVVWSVGNSFNQVSNAEVRATLPSYVKWTNLSSPSSEIISFNKVTNEVVWNIGSILPNTGFGSPKKEVYFQLEFLPSISQVGQTPNLLGGATFSGIDKITGLKIESKTNPGTISFFGDPTFKVGDDKVVE
ncbi:MAG: hypothetical protein WC657_00135 [Candidatus Paceibacterota bacterium]|jgi:hypothetical protein